MLSKIALLSPVCQSELLEHVADGHYTNVLIYAAEKMPDSLSQLGLAESTKTEKKYMAACTDYLVHLTAAITKNPFDDLAQKKIAIILNAINALLTDDTESKQRKKEFKKTLMEGRDILSVRRDHAGITFLKGLGVFAATLLTLGIGGYYASSFFFGKKATKGKQLLTLLDLPLVDNPKQ